MNSHAFHRQFPEALAARDLPVEADYLLFASTGAFILEVEHRQWFLPSQRAALIPKGTPISVRTTGPTTSSSVLFRGGELTHRLQSLSVFVVSDLGRLMIDRATRWGADAVANQESNTFFSALADVVIELSRSEQDTWLPRATSPGLVKAIDHGLADLSIEISLASLADIAGMSERTLTRRFHTELDLPWTAFRHRARMIKAMELLNDTGATVTQAGFAVGFDSTSAFIRAFRNFTGLTPRAFQRSLA
jgi:AraC-like DNA-binding protein